MKKLFNFPILILIPLILAILFIIPGSVNNSILETEISFYHWIKPAQTLSEEIVIITIGDEDIRVLGGWPISRDYYSYCIHALKQSGASVIGLDLLFSGPDRRYPRYDSTMAEFISLAGNVVLPMFFTEIRDTSSIVYRNFGEDPHFSLPIIRNAAAANGFSNLGLQPVIYRVPLVINSTEGYTYSFAAELYRIYHHTSRNPSLQKSSELFEPMINQKGYIYLNFPRFDELTHKYSFVELLQTFRNNPDSVRMDEKIAVVLNTVTGVSQLKSIPLNDRIPASYIHMTALHNMINENWIRFMPIPIGWLLVFLFGSIFLVAWPERMMSYQNIILLILAFIYIFLTVTVFISLDTAFPLVYPLFSLMIGFLLIRIAKIKSTQSTTEYQSIELDKQLSDKEQQLESARSELKDLYEKLEIEAAISENSREQVVDYKEAINDLQKELDDLRAYIHPQKKMEPIDVEGIVFSKTSPLQEVLDLVMKVSMDDIPVLITGETGTGKELIAQTIHEKSKRHRAPFIAINCGALPETLLESELFGHEKGSFTGATALRKGRFELADGGTIFLDEITETSPAFQSRLLRILQESTFERVGGQIALRTDIRIIAATNKDIQKLIAQEKFRSDLFYRLNGFPITVPPLRERDDDIPLLADYFIKKHGYDDISGFSTQAMQKLTSYSWPGNVRELENYVRRAAILAQSEGRQMIQETDLPQDIRDVKSALQLQIVHKPLEEQILELMRTFKFSRSSIIQTANLLGNRDRGTITEYFKGICFQHLVDADYRLSQAVINIAGSTDQETVENLSQKITDYLSNLENYAGIPAQAGKPTNQQAPPFKGLPAKFDPYLDQILANLKKINKS